MSSFEYTPLRKQSKDTYLDKTPKLMNNPINNKDQKILNSLLQDLDTQIDGNLKTYLKSNDNLRRSTLTNSKTMDQGDDSQKTKSKTKTVVQNFEKGKHQTKIEMQQTTPSKFENYSYFRESLDPSLSQISEGKRSQKNIPMLNTSKFGSQRFNEHYDLNNSDRSHHMNTFQEGKYSVDEIRPNGHSMGSKQQRTNQVLITPNNVFKDSLGERTGDKLSVHTKSSSANKQVTQFLYEEEVIEEHRDRNVTFTKHGYTNSEDKRGKVSVNIRTQNGTNTDILELEIKSENNKFSVSRDTSLNKTDLFNNYKRNNQVGPGIVLFDEELQLEKGVKRSLIDEKQSKYDTYVNRNKSPTIKTGLFQRPDYVQSVPPQNELIYNQTHSILEPGTAIHSNDQDFNLVINNQEIEIPKSIRKFTVRDFSKSFLDRKEFLINNQMQVDEEVQLLRQQILNLENMNRTLIQTNNNLNINLVKNENEGHNLKAQVDFQSHQLEKYFLNCEEANNCMEIERKVFIFNKKYIDIGFRIREKGRNDPIRGNVIQRIINRNIKHSATNRFEVDYLGDLKEILGVNGSRNEIHLLEASQTIPVHRK